MTFHFPDEVVVNQLTIDATDRKWGTAVFKAAAVLIDRLHASLDFGADTGADGA
jgi:formate dehydrogenase major subunit